MKTVSKKAVGNDELRSEYKASDFPAGFVRGKYVKPLLAGPNVMPVETARRAVRSRLRSLRRTSPQQP
jgi:hypothetical protein